MRAPHGGIATLHPAYFAMVMATGIVSIACGLLDMPSMAWAMLWANSAFYVVLWVLTVLRIARFRDRFVADLTHHGRAVGFFTIVAATCGALLLLAPAWLAVVR